MAAKKVSSDLCGKWLRGSDGNVYRASMWTAGDGPWGRPDGDDSREVAEVPRPFVVLKAKPKDCKS